MREKKSRKRLSNSGGEALSWFVLSGAIGVILVRANGEARSDLGIPNPSHPVECGSGPAAALDRFTERAANRVPRPGTQRMKNQRFARTAACALPPRCLDGSR